MKFREYLKESKENEKIKILDKRITQLKSDEGLVDIGQLSNDEVKALNYLVKKGIVKKIKKSWAGLRIEKNYYYMR